MASAAGTLLSNSRGASPAGPREVLLARRAHPLEGITIMLNLDQVLGIVRALLTALGGWLIAQGYVTSDVWTAVAGAVASGVTVFWSWRSHELAQAQAMGFVRALLGAAGGFAMSKGWISADQATQWTGVGLMLAAAVWSYVSHADPTKPNVNPPQALILLLCLPLMGLGGCAALNLSPQQQANLTLWIEAGKQVVRVTATLYCVMEPTTTQIISVIDTSSGTAKTVDKIDKATTIACQAAAKAGIVSGG
jgi:hypothetical protein